MGIVHKDRRKRKRSRSDSRLITRYGGRSIPSPEKTERFIGAFGASIRNEQCGAATPPREKKSVLHTSAIVANAADGIRRAQYGRIYCLIIPRDISADV